MNYSTVMPNNPLSMMSSTYRQTSIGNPNSAREILPETLTVFNSMTGARLETSYYIFTTMDILKKFIAESFDIPIENLFLLTPFGIKLKFSMVVNEEINEIYVYDRKFFNVNNLSNENEAAIQENTKAFLAEFNRKELISMIKPMVSPIISDKLSTFVNSLDKTLKSSQGSNLQSSQIDLNSLRTLSNSLKRNSGWAAALLSDFKRTVLQDQMSADLDNENSISFNNEDIRVMITSLSVLIQHIKLSFNVLEKKYNSSIDTLIHLENNSMIDSWHEHYAKLKKIHFEYSKPGGGLESLRLSDLIDEKLFEAYSSESKNLANQIHAKMPPIRDQIEKEIISLKNELSLQYDNYRNEFLNISDTESGPQNSTAYKKMQNQHELITKSKDIIVDLEDYVQQVIKGSKDMPSFEELITTAGENATQLSSSSIEKIRSLVEIFKFQESIIVPKITKLANELYDIQISKLNSRQELQSSLISKTLVLITRIQYNSGKISKSINTDLVESLKVLEENELQLSIVSDLPLLFGIWVIANLNNIKWGMSVNKLAQRTNEIFEMLKYVEVSNRSKWLGRFLEKSSISSKDPIVDIAFLNLSEEEKSAFANSNISKISLSIEDTNSAKLEGDGNSSNGVTNNLTTPTRNVFTNYQTNGQQAVGHIISPLNKFINAFPGKYPSHANAEISSPVNQQKEFLSNISKFITIKDVFRYIKSLRDAGIDENVVNQLEVNVSESGIGNTGESATPKIRKNSSTGEEEQIIVNDNIDGVGSFDTNDPSFMKLFEKFLKSFEIAGFEIYFNTIRNENEDKKRTKEELIKGYETRIKKLENLLHQQKFLGFSEKWSQRQQQLGVDTAGSVNNLSGSKSTNAQNTILFADVQLGQKRKMISLPPSHLGEKVNELAQANEQLTEEIKVLKQQLEDKVNSDKNAKANEELSTEVSKLKAEINSLKKAHDEEIKKKDLQIKKLQDHLEKATNDRRDVKEINTRLEKENKDLTFMKSDLLANMSEKEHEFNKESEMNQKEINELKLKIEELEEDEQNLVDTNRSYVERISIKDQLLCDLYELTQCMYHMLNNLSNEIFGNLTRCCLLLESIGLLLIRDTPSLKGNPGILTIKRVKGLRSRKKAIKQQEGMNSIAETTNFDDDIEPPMDNALLEVVSSEVVPEAEHYVHWLDTNVVDGFTLSSDFGIEDDNTTQDDNDALVNCDKTNCEESNIEKKIKKLLNNYTRLNIEEGFANFLNYNHIDNQLVVEKVYRRFNDVESLARRLQKEKNFTKSELKNCKYELSSRVVLRNFKVGDLALFLKTLDSNNPEIRQYHNGKARSHSNSPTKSIIQPWAAFNVGAPNYYLSNNKYTDSGNTKVNQSYIDLGGRDWMLARIIRIEGKAVTDQNYNNPKENPYGVAKGLTWYLVEANEEKFEEHDNE